MLPAFTASRWQGRQAVSGLAATAGGAPDCMRLKAIDLRVNYQ